MTNEDMPNLGFFLKFIEPQYLDDFLKGHVHFSSLYYFNEVERNGNSIIGDDSEGAYTQNLTNATAYLQIEGDPKIYEFPVSHAISRYDMSEEDKNHYGIASFFYLTKQDFVEHSHSENQRIYVLKKEVIDYFRTFNTDKRVPVIIYTDPFIDLLKKQNTPNTCGKVHYYDDDDPAEFAGLSQMDNFYDTIPFLKRKRYSDQKEFRVCVVLDKGTETSRGEEFELGDMSNMALPLKFIGNQHLAIVVDYSSEK
ncbi:hypothetical protein [Levilactobacillus bambusae]|uniref:Uncharacterized protein n=1 Tax=Levilactobacillus bambusae TaxID=2024736 RepID=A0A2V1MZA9_9LACO|nr:hypothetical protein [Levilactobacillus bambusae]PWF99494.1 hypothetical protein DCM90_08590 [Levilactobacillus bambusae]